MLFRPLTCLALAMPAFAHTGGPAPVPTYDFSKAAIITGEKPTLRPPYGPIVEISTLPLDEPVSGKGLRFAGSKDAHHLAATADELAKHLPQREFTLAAWLTIDRPTPSGAIFSALEDRGGAERELALGYNNSKPYVALATHGGNDGDGKLAYLTSSKPWKKGQIHQLVATYDGTILTLFLDGEPVATSRDQSDDILWPQSVQAWLGGYRDSDENFPHAGRLIDFRLYNVCANPDWVKRPPLLLRYRQWRRIRHLGLRFGGPPV